jgi:ABC-type glutathione transport system ATPase component
MDINLDNYPVSQPHGQNEQDSRLPQSSFKNLSEEQLRAIEERNMIPIQLHFKDLRYSVPISGKEKRWWQFWKKKGQEQKMRTIIDGVTGTVDPGKLLAILGSSGAGYFLLSF